VGHAELLSFLLFTPEFARALTAMGQRDANRWLQSDHDGDVLWQEGPLPVTGCPPGSLRAADARSERAATPTRGCI
jgi:hypothetical protein